MAKSKSRPQRWAEVCADAYSAASVLREHLEELNSIRQEYEEWKDNLPENLQSSSLNDKLEVVVDLDVDDALSSIEDIENLINEAEGADLPRGFGRD